MKTIVIIGAMPSELADIRNTLGEPEIKRFSGFDFYINQYKGNTIVNACCGIAKVNAALCTQVAIDNFHPDHVINAGIAGSMNTAVKVCDIVISTEVLPHDLDLHFLKDYPPYCGIFKADEKLIATAEKVCGEFGVNSFRGRIVSGEAFISSNEVKNEIKDRLDPHAVDMESAAVGHCCFLNDMPFVSVRCISDNADDEGAMSFDEFEKIAAKRVAEIVLRMTELL
ncbi:MAG: 5'-methylthioadenosine/adenosylhomocysteine nucleosidase [Ruminococcus sp.]|nr:5'-methylthioadenosine/adenosylhomocysteine nucleosidase [Ruminococcus sp.]